MSMQDPIADMFTRIRNAQRAGHATVTMPYSTCKEAIAKILQDEGFISAFEKITEVANKPALQIELRYSDVQQRKPVISQIKRVSRPGLRQYVKQDELPRVFGGFGLAIVSTSQGLMSAKNARVKKIGGEVIGQVW